MYRLRLYCLLFVFISCDFFQPKITEEVVAQAGEHFLYKKDINNLVSSGLSAEDSTRIVNTFINNWATRMLLLEKAEMNLSQEKLQGYNDLADNYKADLYTKGYLDIMATKTLDSTIKESDFLNYYEQNNQNFLLNEELVQIRYMHINKENTAQTKLKEAFYRFNEKDQTELNEKSHQFRAYSFNDSLWVQANAVMEKISAVNRENFSLLLKKTNNIELQDSLGVYLIFVKDVKLRNEVAPITYVKPTIKQIILNQRKLEIIKNFEKDILQDAIKSKKFKIYSSQDN